MKTTIRTGMAVLALVSPIFAGDPVIDEAPTPVSTPEVSHLGLSGEISLGYQNQFAFRGLSGVPSDVFDLDGLNTDNVVIAHMLARYTFTENFTLVGGAVLRTLPDGDLDHNTYRFGAMWQQEGRYSFEIGYQYHDFRSSIRNESSDEIYANFGFLCPFTGAQIDLFYAHALSGLPADSTGFEMLNGDYIDLTALKAFHLADWASIEVELGVSYAIDYWTDTSDFNNWHASLYLPLKVNDHVSITPYVMYMDGLGATENVFGVPGVAGFDESDQVIWGVKATVTF